ncbi:MAG TPA: hypothetical protein VGZ22_08320 [Isosphaeraceae bacterium]|jgi:hypothetical protein|nr:hypothetical protein [Isosphaeraceae bacterium]
MSYLSVPRLVFAGQFQADPSTVNNDPEHFDTSAFKSSYQQPGQNNGWWNPAGTGAWGLTNCTVQRVVYRDGTTTNNAQADPIIGAAINGQPGIVGRLVDLDPEQQMVSQIWGLKVTLGQPGGSVGFSSDFQVAAFADLWARFPAGNPDSFFGAFYQSVLEAIQWAGAGGSRFLQELSQDGVPQRLSIRFNVDGYNDDSTSPSFTEGRVVGAIGLYLPGEPSHFVAGRALQTASDSSPLNAAYAQVDGNVLAVDLGNSLPTQSPGGPLANSGSLSVALLPPNGAPVVVGPIDYLSPAWYEETAGIVSFPLSQDLLSQAKVTPVGVVRSSAGGVQPLLSEAPDGDWVRADDFVFRLDPGDTATTTFHVTTFGQASPNRQISLGYDASMMAGQTNQGPIPGPSVVGQPQAALTFPTSITTGSDGTITLSLLSADPGSPRSYIDGQVYGVSYALGNSPPPVGSVSNPSQMLSVLVWSGYTAPAQPTWVDDVEPVFQQYANLYPVMRPIVDLSNFDNVVARRELISNVMKLPVTNPIYMPVTRDLSRAKREMILKWLAHPIKTR